MKKCCMSLLYVLPLLGIAAAVNLRRSAVHKRSIFNSTPAGIDYAQSQQPRQRAIPIFHKKIGSRSDYGTASEIKLTLHNYKGVQYTGPIMLNDQKLSAVYDTGSFEVMAMSSSCSVCKVPSDQFKYDSTKSLSFASGKMLNTETHGFAGGNLEAKQDFETVHIGDAKSMDDIQKDMTVENMPFWQVVKTDMKVWINTFARFTAIVGLGHRPHVPGSPSDSLLERSDIHRFAICLQKGEGAPGFITFNPNLHQPSLSQASFIGASANSGAVGGMFRRLPVVSKHHWAVALEHVSDGESSTCADASCVAVIDSGTSLLGVPPSGVKFIRSFTARIKEDCSNLLELPDMVFQLGGHRLVMPAAAYVVKWDKDNETKCLPAFTDIDIKSNLGDLWIFGMPFLRQFYTVFDRVEPSIYVAEQGENCEPAPSLAATGSSIMSGFFERRPQEPSTVDVQEAMLPSWASAGYTLDS